MTLFVGSFSLFFAEGLRFYREIKRLNRIDNFLPTFVRDITEEVKRGVSPTIAIRSILEVKSYGKELDDILQKISSGISSGLSLEDAVMQVKSKLSWNGLIIFKLFYEASRFGGSGEVFEEFSDVVRELADSNKALKKGISPLRSFGIMTLFLIIFVTGMLVRLIVVPMSSYAEILSEVSTKGGGFLLGLKLIKPEALPGFIDLVFSGLMVNAILLGLITGKMVEGKIGIGFIYVAIYLLISMMAMFGIMLGVSIK
jgi:flagellar protein FlaJ